MLERLLPSTLQHRRYHQALHLQGSDDYDNLDDCQLSIPLEGPVNHKWLIFYGGSASPIQAPKPIHFVLVHGNEEERL